MSETLSEAFLEIAKLAERLGVPPMNEVAGCWEHQIDERWWIAVNGHREPVKTAKASCRCVNRDPAECFKIRERDAWTPDLIGQTCDCACHDGWLEQEELAAARADPREGSLPI